MGYGHYLDAAPAPMLATAGALDGGEVADQRAAQSPVQAEQGHQVAVHEQVVRHEVIGGLLADEPRLEPDVVFGIQATGLLEDRPGAHLLDAWRAGRSALRKKEGPDE